MEKIVTQEETSECELDLLVRVLGVARTDSRPRQASGVDGEMLGQPSPAGRAESTVDLQLSFVAVERRVARMHF